MKKGRAKEDITGLKVGTLTVLGEDLSVTKGKVKWLCECECGKIVSLFKSNLLNAKSCGCRKPGLIKDLTGQKFNRLTVIRETIKRKGSKIVWECLCDCGKIHLTTGYYLTSGKVKSCGCYTKDRITKHGLTGTPEYSSWEAMNQRCNNENSTSYPNYGGRGIKICSRWQGENGFENFLEDMGHQYSNYTTIERIDVNGDYEPSNCKWDSTYNQNRNKRNNHLITFNGETLCVTDWAERLGIHSNSLQKRLKKWPIEKAMTTKRTEVNIYKFRGQLLSIPDIMEIYGIHKNTIQGRLDRGMSLDQAIYWKKDARYKREVVQYVSSNI